jgi:hypothetical protein
MTMYVDMNMLLNMKRSLESASMLIDNLVQRKGEDLLKPKETEILPSLELATSNLESGFEMFEKAKEGLCKIKDNLYSIKSLFEETSEKYIDENEVIVRMNEIDRISNSVCFKGEKLLNGTIYKDKVFLAEFNKQIENITISSEVFSAVTCKGLGISLGENLDENLLMLQKTLEKVENKYISFELYQRKLKNAMNILFIQTSNIRSSITVTRDTDIVTESFKLSKNQEVELPNMSFFEKATEKPAVAVSM